MLIAFAAALLAPAAPAVSAPPAASSSAAVDPAAIAEAMRLLDQEGFEDQVLQSSEMTLDLLLASMASDIQRRSGEPVPEDLFKELEQTIRDHASSTLRANMNEMKQQAAVVYAQEFTREELVRLRELSSDPVMVKARERNKVIQPKLMALGAHTMRGSQEELEAKIERIVSEFLARQEGNSES